MNSERFFAPGASYFWTSTPSIAQELANQLKLPPGRLGWDVYLLYGKGMIWDKGLPTPSYWAHHIGVPQGEPFDRRKFQDQTLQLLRQK